MATSTYFKPDVEVFQEFRSFSPVVLRATLQSVVVGPSYQNLVDHRIGAYSAAEVELPISGLANGAELIESSLEVTIKNYAGDHSIEKTVVRTQGNSGSWIGASSRFVDLNQDFVELGVKASTGPGNNDGDYVHILVGAKTGYYEIQQVVDAHTLVIDANLGSVDIAGFNYTVGSFGWELIDLDDYTKAIKLSPRLSDSGIVYMNVQARRKDYTERLAIGATTTELETLFGEAVSLKNPLAYGMAKSLQSLGPNDLMLGLMTEDDSPAAYQKAFELLETEEVYCIVPLSTNPIVHQMLSEHVTVMSAGENKMERIGLFNTQRYNRVVRSGYFGRQDPISKAWSMASGSTAASGVELSDITQTVHDSKLADGSGVEQVVTAPAGYERAVVYFRPAVDYSLSYSLTSAPATDIAVSVDSDGKLSITAPAGDSISAVKFTSTAVSAEKCEMFFIKHVSEPVNTETFYPSLINGGTQMHVPYVNPTGGHRAIKVRHFDVDFPTADPLIGDLPHGMTLRIAYGNGESTDVTSAGSHSFSGDIQSIYIFNASGVVDANKHLVEVLVLENAGTYRINTLIDEDATFLSDKIIGGEDELVVVNHSIVDETTFSKYKETRYKVAAVLSETSLVVNQIWDAVESDFDLGEFPAIDSAVTYRVETPVITNKYELATWYRDISKGFLNRRMSHIFAPAVGVSDDGVTITPVPGYYFACAYAGATQSARPQDGFTNRPFAGFVKVFFTNDYFTESQMDIIAEGGTTIVIQSRIMAPLSVRHQLTTDMTSIKTREYSITKNLDHMAKTARITFRPYIGRYLINDDTLSILYSVGGALVELWKKAGQLISGSVDQFLVDPTQEDRVTACFNMKLPIPLNYIKLTFVL